MERRLIDANVARAEIDSKFPLMTGYVERWLDSQPTVEPRTAKKVYNCDHDFVCDLCKEYVYEYDKYCSNCGAKFESEVSK